MGHRLLAHKTQLCDIMGDWGWKCRKTELNFVFSSPQHRELREKTIRSTLPDIAADEDVTDEDAQQVMDAHHLMWHHPHQNTKLPKREGSDKLRQVRKYGLWPGPAWWYLPPSCWVEEQQHLGSGNETTEVDNAVENTHTRGFIADLFLSCWAKCNSPRRAVVRFFHLV